MSGPAVRTIGTMFVEALVLLQDVAGVRFSNDEMMEAFNGALIEARMKRPDLFIDMGMRTPVPYYVASTDLGVPFPIDLQYYNAFLYYIVGRMDLRESVSGDTGRAAVLMNKFVSQLTGVVS
jgi:hypothetical protein